ncbi:hypothetical protein [Fervidibacillus albus]|uniref:PepSY domain-containing protein n=1 Tax=Fervidibacillus albus TaxID=2980026 RepID=A0A9E8LV73_9BACI|nr:hypothetical protein [Fervidibacillus albus]WAA10087.1 hypothetical protein OE104_01715 [Fervidibacillus albus]
MKWKGFFVGFAISTAIGLFSKSNNKRKFRSEDILHIVKNELKPYGKVTGSWILAQPERMENGESTISVYKGGVTQLRKGKRKYIEFIVDAHTGEMIHHEIISG